MKKLIIITLLLSFGGATAQYQTIQKKMIFFENHQKDIPPNMGYYNKNLTIKSDSLVYYRVQKKDAKFIVYEHTRGKRFPESWEITKNVIIFLGDPKDNVDKFAQNCELKYNKFIRAIKASE